MTAYGRVPPMCKDSPAYVQGQPGPITDRHSTLAYGCNSPYTRLCQHSKAVALLLAGLGPTLSTGMPPAVAWNRFGLPLSQLQRCNPESSQPKEDIPP